MTNAVASWQKALRYYRHRLKQFVCYSEDPWARVFYLREWQAFLLGRGAAQLDVLEISPGTRATWANFGFRSYRSVQYPEFDLTRETLPDRFDIIIAEHVFEHIRHPYRAARAVRTMLRPDGVFLIATPFLARIHGFPYDYTRWTPDGLRAFLEDCGFEADVHAWGNRKIARANLLRVREWGWGRSLRTEPNLPVVVWAYARPTSDPLPTVDVNLRP